MIQTFVEKNRKLLLFYYWTMRIGGWFFLGLSFLAVIGHSIALSTRIADSQEFSRYWQHDVPWGMFTYLIPAGILAIGVAQFIRYLRETDCQPDWILRNADKLFYTYTAILIAYYCWVGITEVISRFDEPYDFPLRLIMLVIFILVKLLALIGVAEVLRRLLPMFEESRTLV